MNKPLVGIKLRMSVTRVATTESDVIDMSINAVQGLVFSAFSFFNTENYKELKFINYFYEIFYSSFLL